MLLLCFAACCESRSALLLWWIPSPVLCLQKLQLQQQKRGGEKGLKQPWRQPGDVPFAIQHSSIPASMIPATAALVSCYCCADNLLLLWSPGFILSRDMSAPGFDLWLLQGKSPDTLRLPF
jgi:hypothetical protein